MAEHPEQPNYFVFYVGLEGVQPYLDDNENPVYNEFNPREKVDRYREGLLYK